MKATVFLLLAACVPVLASPQMTARFANGDEISGTLSGFEGDSMIWESGFFKNPQPLSLDQLEEISFQGEESIKLPDGDHLAVVTLTNEDIVRGSLVSLDEQQVVLRTTFAGDLTFRRDMVAALSIEEKPEIIFAGPTSIEEWHVAKEDDWTFEHGELISNGRSSISRDIGKHDQFRIAFDVEWRGNPRFRIFTSADSADLNKIGNTYELVCQSQYAYMRKRTKRNGKTESVTMGSTGAVPEFQEREKVRIEILHDLTTGRARLILGGRTAADWREPAPGAGRLGGHIHFISDSGRPLRISRIRVSSWDGSIDGKWQDADMNPFAENENEEEEEEESEDLDQTGILLRNGDHIEGDAIGIDNGTVNLKTDLGEFSLPVSRLRSFALRTAEEAADPELTWKPIIRNGDIRAHFSEGDYITFELLEFMGDGIRGKSQTFGEAEFELSAFNRLEFNLYSTDEDDW